MGGGLKLGIYYAFFSNFLCLTFSFKPSSPINNCMQIFYGSARLHYRQKYRNYSGHVSEPCLKFPSDGSTIFFLHWCFHQENFIPEQKSQATLCCKHGSFGKQTQLQSLEYPWSFEIFLVA